MGIISKLMRGNDVFAEFSLSENCEEWKRKCALSQLIIESCISLISKSFASIHFRVYEKQKEVENKISYRLNVAPNDNESAATFWRMAVSQMLLKNEAIVYNRNDKFYLPDSFTVNKGIYKTSKYQLTFNELDEVANATSDDVLHLKYHTANMKSLAECVTDDAGKALKRAYSEFIRTRAGRGVVKIGTQWSQKHDHTGIQDMVTTLFKGWFDGDTNKIVPLQEGFDYDEIEQKAAGASDAVSLSDNMIRVVALAFNVSPDKLLNGGDEAAQKALMTDCINPIAKIIEGELNRAMLPLSKYLEGTRVEADLSNVQLTSILEQAKNMDVLFRIGYSINDILRQTGKNPIPEDWANKHYITKNYDSVTNIEGGKK